MNGGFLVFLDCKLESVLQAMYISKTHCINLVTLY